MNINLATCPSHPFKKRKGRKKNKAINIHALRINIRGHPQFNFHVSEKINSTFYQGIGCTPSRVFLENKNNLRKRSTFSEYSNVIVNKEFHKQQNCVYQGYMKGLNMQVFKKYARAQGILYP